MAAMMSQPPTSSPPAYSCGKVGQSENFCAGWQRGTSPRDALAKSHGCREETGQ